MNLLITQTDYNSVAVIILLLLILYFASGFNKRIANLYRPAAYQYLNTTARLKALDYAPDAIITIDIEGEILAWNGGACNMFGYKEKETMGKRLDFIMPERYRERHRQSIEGLRENMGSQILGKPRFLEAIDKKGREFPIKLILWKWTEGAQIFFTGIIRDITEQKAKEDKIQNMIQMYDREETINKSGVWSWDILNDKVSVSPGFKKIFNIDKDYVDSTYLLKRVYYEDLKRVEDSIRVAFETKQGYKIQYRIVNTNGSLVFVEISAETYFNEDNELINITGTIHLV